MSTARSSFNKAKIDQGWKRLFWSVDGTDKPEATESIHMQAYIFDDDETKGNL
ncbi:MAG: hypothetical protein IPL84_12265 [Chitinophagaceae bacterium]|nr:hypothetical protein [Chitinophagaceae bacterium]